VVSTCTAGYEECEREWGREKREVGRTGKYVEYTASCVVTCDGVGTKGVEGHDAASLSLLLSTSTRLALDS
jgi:hypothetical protein